MEGHRWRPETQGCRVGHHPGGQSGRPGEVPVSSGAGVAEKELQHREVWGADVAVAGGGGGYTSGGKQQ